ncbi:MAG: Jag N-terminal domain-containing protein [Oscillospiraceae bacterium]|jgi:spoIIIJ-associated protein|nr:Jag N-terminal domain-containing protein [Oscillospiraceae bacterium]
MLKEAIATAATLEAAIEAAKLELKAPEDTDVQTEILETPTKKTLGLFGGAPAKVRLYYEESEFARAENYLRDILRCMGVQANVLTVEEDEGVRFSLDCAEDYGYVIGRRGETLDALQYLTRLVVSRNAEQYHRVSVNVGDYREQRELTLRELATRTTGKVKKFGNNITLAPMSAYDRRIIHTVVQETEGVNSFSVGEGSDRRVVVAPDEKYRKPNNSRPGGGYNNGRRDDRFSGNRNRFNDDRRPSGDRFNNNNGSSGSRYNNSGDRRPDAPGQDFRRAATPPPAAPNRAPRSDTNAGRYGKIERSGDPKTENDA